MIPIACNCLEDFHRVYLYRTLGTRLVPPEDHDKLVAIVSDSSRSWEQRAWMIAALSTDSDNVQKIGRWVFARNRDYQTTVHIAQRYYGEKGPRPLKEKRCGRPPKKQKMEDTNLQP